MDGLQAVRFATTDALVTKRGRRLDGLVNRAPLARTGRARALPSSRLKRGANEKAAEPVRLAAAFAAAVPRVTKPGPS
jgi:hypothetical protein